MPNPNMQSMKQMFQFPMYQKSPSMQGAAGSPLAGLMDNLSPENMPSIPKMQGNPMTEAQMQEYLSKPLSKPPQPQPKMKDMINNNPLLERYKLPSGDYEI